MKIETINYFELKDNSGGQSYDSIVEEKIDFDVFLKNPMWIDVCNDLQDGVLYVLNSHEFGGFIKYTEGINRFSVDTFITVGAWHVKYKTKC